MCPWSRVRTAVILAAVLFAPYSISRLALGQCELDWVDASDADSHDHFGASVAVDGDFVVIGAPGTERAGREYVPSYIFQRSDTAWVEHTILSPDDISPRSQFGRSVAISGDVVVVGAIIDGHSDPYEFDGPGSAYVYRFNGTTWIEESKLWASDASVGNFFGSSVAIESDRIIVGARGSGRHQNTTGVAYVFEFVDGRWNEVTKLIPSDGVEYDYFGNAVAAEANLAVVGALNVGHTEQTATDGTGAVYVFRFDGKGWSEEAKLTVKGLPPRSWLGGAVSVSGDLILAGASGDDAAGHDSGAAYIFRREGSEWVREARLLGEDTEASDSFGSSVFLEGGLAVVGAYYTGWGVGSVYVFQRHDTSWRQVAKLMASNGYRQHRFGSAVALDDDIIAVGAVGGRGSTYFYQIGGEPDCNANGINDACEPDCNDNGIPDQCDITSETSEDCNINGIPDECELDCNENDVPDDCDIGEGTSGDCNVNGIPDECEVDCNGNEVPDDCDIADETSDDCNANRVPDDCEPDCNQNGVADSCDIDFGTSEDCNRNVVPDTCEPDRDCNDNGVQDICDIAEGTSDDCNETGVPDECEVAMGRLLAADLPGLEGVYGGWTGPWGGGSEYTFRQEFAVVRNAWMRVTASTYFPGVVGLRGCLDDECEDDVVYVTSNVESCVPLTPSDAALDGVGVVRVNVFPPCCDQKAEITDATLWFDATPLPAPTDLSDFADFQTCFSGEGVPPAPGCNDFDYDRDDDVDLDDHAVFRRVLAGPE